jgi:hypothetical protein
MGFIGFVLIAVYFGYNMVQVAREMGVGADNKELFKLFFFAAPIDLWHKISGK